MKKTALQIGSLGELLVQQKLLEKGIDSARLTTDYGIDLVSVTPRSKITIEVKTCDSPKPAGGKGKPAIDWRAPIDCPADYYAFVYYQERKVWLFQKTDLESFVSEGVCQKKGPNYHLCMYLKENVKARRLKSLSYFDEHLFEKKYRILSSGSAS